MSASGTTDDPRPDPDLVAAAAGGDRDAFAALYRRHRERVFAIAVRMLRNREAALDLTQDVFVRLLHRLDRFDGRSAFTTWLHRVTMNACYDELRRRPVDLADPSEIELHIRALGDPGETRPVALDIIAALAELSTEHRAVVVLHDLEGYRYEEIAEICDIPVGTVKSRLARARLRLAGSLTATGNIAGDVVRLNPTEEPDARS